MLFFKNDYSEGAYPKILEKLIESNFDKHSGYGNDDYTKSAIEKIKKACNLEDGEVHLLVGGTQANLTVISSILRPHEAVISPSSGHIANLEAGAIEHTGHKVICLDNIEGKISANTLKEYMKYYQIDPNRMHKPVPKMLYISFPTEYGTLYSKEELLSLKAVCEEYDLDFFIDGARLAYALSSEYNDLNLEDLAKISDVFYIGGTKCGTLCGEAIVITKDNYIRNFKTLVKQKGALLAKSRLIGIQFDVLFTDDLYLNICKNANTQSLRIKEKLLERGYELFVNSYTNQQFVIIENERLKELEKELVFGYIDKLDNEKSIIRICTSWATKDEDVDKLLNIL